MSCERCKADAPELFRGRPLCLLTGEAPRALTPEEQDQMIALRAEIAAGSGCDLPDVPTVRFPLLCRECKEAESRANLGPEPEPEA